ncbi:PQQ-dependent sugar dehydrogenase [Tropicibacter naphthalenivorans]|uniref:Soluble aldose sugar dehydrogenase YliI n=1 Tax=Tropicibacter naphthalenivorans TaxID=441103 RepID=A0A0P1G6T1_9RHOB|nr:PQQ-dependent sugar dehydrogenase [Tropicibacter naphthalenivorans]CUH77440.1 Soluble aldose sugar dehydrogenase YliI precursor [Tropicibacter naphthalenivorans]SMC57516.1 Glucose/arabinose dehydrogenase, beta-propeller fold [Tropicibacter naphthalenivorans]
MRHSIFTIIAPVVLAFPAVAETIESSIGPLEISAQVEGLQTPWAFDFLPGGAILITEREGRLWIAENGQKTEVSGLPKIKVDGQGGLLDVMVPRDFAETREVFFTYAKSQWIRGSGTAVYRATLSEDGTRLTNGETIFEIKRGTGGGYHFGSRLVEARDGTLFVTIGDRGNGDLAQDLSMHNGSVVRITRDGEAPGDNPFVGGDGLAEIYSYGHRNPQGAALDPSGQLWVAEHGAQGGDEVNRIEAGVNYGWPVISYGVNYNGTKIGEGTAKDGMAQPVHYWDPSIAPSGMAFYDGDLLGDWRGDAFVGSLKFDYISRLSGDPLTEVEQIKGEATARVRDVAQGPDGALWFLSVLNDALYRIAPQ